jgi:hypothetical protein
MNVDVISKFLNTKLLDQTNLFLNIQKTHFCYLIKVITILPFQLKLLTLIT